MASGSRRGLFAEAVRDLPPGRIPTVTMKARHRSTCGDCGKMIEVGDGLSMIRRNGTTEWRHATCALPCGPGTTAAHSRR